MVRRLQHRGDELLTSMGIKVKKLTTEDFAKKILKNPGTIYSFSTRLNDNRGEICWHHVSCMDIFNTQMVILNKVLKCSGIPVIFALPYYDIETQEMTDNCLNTAIENLNHFHQLHGNTDKVWYIDKTYIDQRIETIHYGNHF